MADFTSNFWPWYIGVIVIASIVGLVVLIRWMTEARAPGHRPETMGHVWDENLEEYNNPLPAWWLKLFYGTLAFAVIYFLLYPGVGIFPGLLGWTQVKQYQQEMAAAEKQYGPLYQRYAQQDLAALARDPEAMKTAERLFVNYCTVCHGSDARGAPGFPNLRDDDWLYGGDPRAIEASILNGRQGTMPAWGPVLKDQGVQEVTQYVLSLSGRATDTAAVEAGREKFQQLCVACHGADARGNPALGAPNLTDDIWLYGGSPRVIAESIRNGRRGRMPAHKDFLGEARVHLLAAYVYSLSHGR